MFKRTVLLIRVFVLLCISSASLSEDFPETKTSLGLVRGTWKESEKGKTYAAYEGIPYAKPPVGDLRFEKPEPVTPWIGVWDATVPYTCMQGNFMMELQNPILGNEDCLHLNVYVPKDKEDDKKYDVIVSIHGGAFMLGSGHMMLNPTYVIDSGIILVSFNYRVGILGFLSTEDDIIPGNNGMKDQVLAMKWVKDHIASFGGNPDSITLVGLSAGGASVHLHYFSPLSRGLFNRGLSQSGTALNPWAIRENPLESAKKLAVSVGCPDSSSAELKACLKTRPAELLMERVKDFYGYKITPIATFAPVIEKASNGAFLTKDPYLLLKEGNVLDVPWITSTTADEGFVPSAFFSSEALDTIDESWHDIAQYLLDYNYTLPVSKRESVAKQIKEFYLGPGQHINKYNFKLFTNMFTHRLFIVGAESAAKLQSQVTKSPVYYYYFNYADSLIKVVDMISHKQDDDMDFSGVSHGEDMLYFYGQFPPHLNASSSDIKMMKICQNILYSYASTGVPSFDGTEKWKPTKSSQLTYLNITSPDDIELHTVDNLSPVNFWAELGILEDENLVVRDEL